MKNKKLIKFYTTEDVQNYVNFINDNDLCDELELFDTGFSNGNFFIDVEGDEDIVNRIKRLSMKQERGKYKRTNEIKLKQSKKMTKK